MHVAIAVLVKVVCWEHFFLLEISVSEQVTNGCLPFIIIIILDVTYYLHGNGEGGKKWKRGVEAESVRRPTNVKEEQSVKKVVANEGNKCENLKCIEQHLLSLAYNMCHLNCFTPVKWECLYFVYMFAKGIMDSKSQKKKLPKFIKKKLKVIERPFNKLD